MKLFLGLFFGLLGSELKTVTAYTKEPVLEFQKEFHLKQSSGVSRILLPYIIYKIFFFNCNFIAKAFLVN